MPSLTRCKNVGGKICCWDRDSKSFFYVDLRLITDRREIAAVTAAFIDDDEPQQDGDGERDLG
jgi:hypothetical protein